MTTSGQVQRSIQRFQEFASDLIRSDMDTFDDRLSVFIHFCETDEFFVGINQQIKSLTCDRFEEWYGERMRTGGGMAGSGDLCFPVDLDLRMAFQFEILRRINAGEIEFLGFTSHFFSTGSKISDHVCALNASVTKPLAREMKHRLEDVIEQLPDDKRTEVTPNVYQVFHQVGNVIQQHASGSNITQSATIALSDDLKAAFADLRAAVTSYEKDAAGLPEHIECIDAAEQLAAAEKPKVSAVKKLLGSLPAIASVTSLIGTILKILSSMS